MSVGRMPLRVGPPVSRATIVLSVIVVGAARALAAVSRWAVPQWWRAVVALRV